MYVLLDRSSDIEVEYPDSAIRDGQNHSLPMDKPGAKSTHKRDMYCLKNCAYLSEPYQPETGKSRDLRGPQSVHVACIGSAGPVDRYFAR